MFFSAYTFKEHVCICSENCKSLVLQDKGNIEQSSRKRRIRRIGTHVFSLGRMIFARRESRVRMFFSWHALKISSCEINTHREIKSPLILLIATRFPVSVDQSYDSDCSVAILTGD